MTTGRSTDNTVDDPHPLAVDTGGGRLDDRDPTIDRPLVTAVVTTYDRPTQAKRAIQSVQAQTYVPLEFLVVEDGTDTDLKTWLTENDYTNVRYVRHAENQGLAGARNTALALANGDYIAFLDDDDAWKPARIEYQMQLLSSLQDAERQETAVVYCGLESRQDGQIQSILYPENDGNLAESIRTHGASTVQSACLFDRTALLDVGGYDETLPSSIDHDIWMSLAVAGYAARTVETPLVISFDDFADSMMTNTDQRISGVRQYVEKWRPTYREWFGPKEGEQYAQRYFNQVIGRLAATKLVTGQLSESATALQAIFDQADTRQYAHAIVIFTILCLEKMVKRFLPPSIVRTLTNIIKTSN